MVHEIRLTVRKRAYPSQGKVRFNIGHLTSLGIHEGEQVDLINESTKKAFTATVIADTVVRLGQVHISEEDLKTVNLQDDDEILVLKTVPRQEKVKKATSNATALTADVSIPAETSGKTVAGKKEAAQKPLVSMKKAAKPLAKPVTDAQITAGSKKKPAGKVP